LGEPELHPFAVLNGTQLDPRFWQIGDGDGDGPPIPGKSGMGPPSPIPGKSGMGMGMGIGGSVPWLTAPSGSSLPVRHLPRRAAVGAFGNGASAPTRTRHHHDDHSSGPPALGQIAREPRPMSAPAPGIMMLAGNAANASAAAQRRGPGIAAAAAAAALTGNFEVEPQGGHGRVSFGHWQPHHTNHIFPPSAARGRGITDSEGPLRRACR
jgi:hypothetical protein